METLHPKPPGLPSEASLSARPHTPPTTPAKRKPERQQQRHRSPASSTAGSRAASIHPTETTSPHKGEPKPSTRPDTFTVSELTEEDAGYATDLDIMLYPAEIEELSSAAASASDHDDEHSTATDVSDTEATSRRLSRLNCGDNRENDYQRQRRRRKRDKRADSRLFKRPHHETMRDYPDQEADSDAIDDHDYEGSSRRLRRRTKGPMDDIVFPDFPRSSPEEAGSPSLAAAGRERRYINVVYSHPDDEDGMEVDGR